MSLLYPATDEKPSRSHCRICLHADSVEGATSAISAHIDPGCGDERKAEVSPGGL